jgi:UDP-N-acetylglucosamine 4,6-dehydratase/5-epimerase
MDFMSILFKNKRILITGGTGSLGQALTKKLLELDVSTIRILSRNESKQVDMDEEFNDDRLRFLIGDIRDKERLIKSLEDIDIIFHAAALKHVPVIEYNPFEAIKTNVIGSQNIIDAAVAQDVKKVICIGTDKSVSPLNTYGATKLLMEKLFVTANNFISEERHSTEFIAVRYGNVFGSSGSIIPKFLEQIKHKRKITVTNKDMTRFSIRMNKALNFILDCTENGKPSEIYIPKMEAYTILDIVKAFQNVFPDVEMETIGIRPGEKFHEVLISEEESRDAWDLGDKFMISNPNWTNDERVLESYNGKIKKISYNNEYSSQNVEKMSIEEIQKLIIQAQNQI